MFFVFLAASQAFEGAPAADQDCLVWTANVPDSADTWLPGLQGSQEVISSLNLSPSGWQT
jgi:hypothetical protein